MRRTPDTSRPMVLIAALAASTLVAPLAWGNAGHVELDGHVSSTIALRAAGFAPGNGARIAARQLAPAALETEVVFSRDGADLTRALGATLTLKIQSNTSYTLVAAVEQSSEELQELPIRMGLHDIRAAGDGARVLPGALDETHAVGAFAGNPLSGDGAGAPIAELAGSPTAIMAGPAPSAGGTMASENNALLVDCSFGAPASLLRNRAAVSLTVSYTLATL